MSNAIAQALGVNPTRVPMLPEYLFGLMDAQRDKPLIGAK